MSRKGTLDKKLLPILWTPAPLKVEGAGLGGQSSSAPPTTLCSLPSCSITKASLHQRLPDCVPLGQTQPCRGPMRDHHGHLKYQEPAFSLSKNTTDLGFSLLKLPIQKPSFLQPSHLCYEPHYSLYKFSTFYIK